MLEDQNSAPRRKFAWADKWVKMTGERGRIDAKVNNTYIVYEKNGNWLKNSRTEMLSLFLMRINHEA